MFEYNIFERITMKLAQHKFGKKIFDKVKGLPEKERIAYCENLKSKLEKDRVKFLETVEEKMKIRDRKEEEWMEIYATGDEKADAFDAGDYAYDENKALGKAIKVLVECDAAIQACDAIAKKMRKVQQTSER